VGAKKIYTHFKKGNNMTTVLPPFSLAVLPVAW